MLKKIINPWRNNPQYHCFGCCPMSSPKSSTIRCASSKVAAATVKAPCVSGKTEGTSPTIMPADASARRQNIRGSMV